MKRVHLSCCAAVAMMAACSSSVYAGGLIDRMIDGPFSISDQDAPLITTGGTNFLIGGQRQVSIDQTAGLPGESTAMLASGLSPLFFDNAGSAVSTLTLDYGNFAGGNGELNADLLLAPGLLDSLGINAYLGGSDPRGFVQLALESSAGNGISAMQSILTGSNGNRFEYTEAGFAAVDFDDIDRITLIITAEAGADITVGQLSVEIPAPGALALLGVAAITGRRRRRE